MGQLLLIAILLTPIAEIASFIWIGGQIGIFSTLAAIIATAVIGVAIIRWQGMGLIIDSRAMMARGEVPARPFAEAMMLAVAGFFLLIPGFLTDTIGFVLLIPPVRAALYGALSRNMVVVSTYRPGGPQTGTRSIDLDPDSYR